MATGIGKTRTAIGIIKKLLEEGKVRRVMLTGKARKWREKISGVFDLFLKSVVMVVYFHIGFFYHLFYFIIHHHSPLLCRKYKMMY